MSTTKSFKRGCNGRRHHKFFTPVYDTFYNALVIIERYLLITVLLHPVVLPKYCLLIDSPIIDCSLAGNRFVNLRAVS